MKILFLDIETAPEFQHFKDLPEDGKAAYKKKLKNKIGLLPGQYLNEEEAYSEAALYAEFSKIICVGIGSISDDGTKIYLKGITGTEEEILTELKERIEKYKPDYLCAHNGKMFDFPFLVRRWIINRLPFPSIFNTEGKKSWEILWLDTMEMWRFTDLKYYVSLITLAYIFKIPSPKKNLDGSQVPQAFFDGKIEEIKTYNLGDVLTLILVFLCIKNKPLIDNVVYL